MLMQIFPQILNELPVVFNLAGLAGIGFQSTADLCAQLLQIAIDMAHLGQQLLTLVFFDMFIHPLLQGCYFFIFKSFQLMCKLFPLFFLFGTALPIRGKLPVNDPAHDQTGHAGQPAGHGQNVK